MQKEDFINQLESLCKELELDFGKRSDKIGIDFSGWTGVRLIIDIKNDKLDFYIWVRTNSWYYIDERTDIHDSVSILLSAWLIKAKKFTISFHDIGHPVIPELDDFEIYARYLVPTQQIGEYLTISEESIKEYRKLIVDIYAFHVIFWGIFGGCPCNECKTKLGIKYDYKNSINGKLQNSINIALGKVENSNLKDRKLPTWQYYRDFDKGISIINSQSIANFLKGLKELDEESKEIESINGILVVNSKLHHFIPIRTEKEINRIFKILEPKIKDTDITYNVFENKVIGIGKKNTLIFDEASGNIDFKRERDLLKIRHDKEFNMLFQPSQIDWKSKLDDSAFEDLIAELFKRESNVLRVRKVSHTRERDGGRDLLVEMKVIPQNNQKIPENVNPYEVISVIVQCKAFQNGVKKTDILDIRDTIEHYECQGYFVAVSSYLKSSLTDHLDSLRKKGKFWIDWWTKQEIEERIKRNEDLLHLYPTLFEAIKD